MKKFTLTLLTALFTTALSFGQVQVYPVNSTTDVSCDGMAYIDSTTIGGAFTWTWYDSLGTIQNGGFYLDSLCPGTYFVDFVDSAGNSTVSFTILSDTSAGPCASFNVNAWTTMDADSGMCNGSVSTSVTGGSGSYFYSWSPSGGFGSTASNLCGGQTYTLTVYDSINNCNASASAFVDEILDTTNQNPCAGFYVNGVTTMDSDSGMCNGSATVNVTGGSGAYSYTWSNGGNTMSISGLCGNALYGVYVTDTSLGCTGGDSIYIYDVIDTTNQNPCANFYVSGIVTMDADSGMCNGTATVNAYGGTGSYSYNWSNGSTAMSATGLCGNTDYGIYVTDAGTGCVAGDTIYVNEVIDTTNQNPCAGFIVNISSVADADSGMCNGSIATSVSGGSGSYYYNWSPSGGFGATATNLCGNQNYTVTVYDSINNCTATATAYVYEIIDSSNIWNNLYADVWVWDATSSAQCDGSADVDVYGGVAPFTYVFTPTGTTSGSTATNLCPGLYDVTVTDAANNTYTTTFMVASLDSIYNNNDSTFVDSTIIDTTNYADPFVDCDIDYNDVVSVSITGYDFSDSTGIDSTSFDTISYFTVEWTIVTGNGSSLTFTEYYQFSSYGVYWCILNIYCDEKSGFYEHLKATDFVNIQEKTLGISAANKINNVEVYPNPASNNLNIDLKGNFTYQLFNMEGQMVQSGSENNRAVLEVGNLPSGMYMVRLMDADMRSTVKKIMVD